MPATPETWLDAFVVNLTTAGLQFDPSIAQLANGNILVTWSTTDQGGLGSPAGTEVLGQIFDPLGVRVNGEFRVNNISQGDNEQDSSIAALPGGGFIVAYRDADISGSGGGNIRIEAFDATGTGGSRSSARAPCRPASSASRAAIRSEWAGGAVAK